MESQPDNIVEEPIINLPEIHEANEPAVNETQKTTEEPLINLNDETEKTDETEKPDMNTGFSAHDRQLTVPEDVVVYLNQLNAANMVVNARIEEYAANPFMRFIDGKYAIVDYPASDPEKPITDEAREAGKKVVMTAEWHLIGEFRINGFDEEKMPNDIEFVWGWAIRPDDPRTKSVVKVAEDLPYGMQPLTFPLVKFEDIGIVEIIKAFAFNTLGLEYITQKYSEQLGSYGIFGLYDIKWPSGIPKVIAPEWANILSVVREIVKAKTEGGMAKKEAVEEAWKTNEVLTLVADYRRKKDAMYTEKQEFVAKFKQALSDPNALTKIMNPGAQQPEAPQEPAPAQEPELDFALASVERAMNAVDEAELAKLEAVGDDLEDVI